MAVFNLEARQMEEREYGFLKCLNCGRLIANNANRVGNANAHFYAASHHIHGTYSIFSDVFDVVLCKTIHGRSGSTQGRFINCMGCGKRIGFYMTMWPAELSGFRTDLVEDCDDDGRMLGVMRLPKHPALGLQNATPTRGTRSNHRLQDSWPLSPDFKRGGFFADIQLKLWTLAYNAYIGRNWRDGSFFFIFKCTEK